jgi:acyl carrier protein
MRDEIIEYIVTLLTKKKPISEEIVLEDLRYIERGYVDSLGLMKFIVQIEDKFAIEILEDDMVSEEFFTVGGLSKIIAEKKC